MLLRNIVFLFTISIANRILVESSAIPYYYAVQDPQAYYAPGVIRSGSSLPEAPTLPPLDLDSLPENLRSVGQGDAPSSDDFVEENSEPELPHVARTFGMNLEGEHGKVWNDLFSQPGVEFEVGGDRPNEEQSEVGITAEADEHPNDNPEDHEESDIFVDTASQSHDEHLPEHVSEEEAETLKNVFEVNVQNYLVEMLSNWVHSHEEQVKEFLQHVLHPTVAETNVTANNDNSELEVVQTEEPLLVDATESVDIDSEDDEAELISGRRQNSHSSNPDTNIKAKNIYGNTVGAEKVTNVFVFLSEHIPEDAAEKLHWLISNDSFTQAYDIDGSNIEQVSSISNDNKPELPEQEISSTPLELPEPSENLNSEELNVEPLPMTELPTEDYTGQDLSTTETNIEYEEQPENLPVEEITAEGIPLEEQPAEEIQPEDPLVQESPEVETPTEGYPADESPVDELPAEELSVDDLPVEELPADQIPAEDLPSEDLPQEEFPAEKLPEEESPLDKSLADESPIDELPAPVEEIYSSESPVDEVPTDELPAEELPVDELPSEESPVEELPADESITEELPIDELPADESPVDEAPVDELPSEELPADELPAESSPDDTILDVRNEEAAEISPSAIVEVQEIPAPTSVSEDAVEESSAEELPIEEATSEDLPEEEIVEDSVLSDEPYVAETGSADLD